MIDTDTITPEIGKDLDAEFRNLPLSVQRELRLKGYDASTDAGLAEMVRNDRREAVLQYEKKSGV